MGVEGDSGKQAVGRRRRYEGEEAWENRGMAQVPFYNSGNVSGARKSHSDPQMIAVAMQSELFFFQIYSALCGI